MYDHRGHAIEDRNRTERCYNSIVKPLLIQHLQYHNTTQPYTNHLDIIQQVVPRIRFVKDFRNFTCQTDTGGQNDHWTDMDRAINEKHQNKWILQAFMLTEYGPVMSYGMVYCPILSFMFENNVGCLPSKTNQSSGAPFKCISFTHKEVINNIYSYLT